MRWRTRVACATASKTWFLYPIKSIFRSSLHPLDQLHLYILFESHATRVRQHIKRHNNLVSYLHSSQLFIDINLLVKSELFSSLISCNRCIDKFKNKLLWI